ncbi:MAG: carbamate kinase [Candidatus Thermoplasmatota archaeon]|nr:carbamate kinase [Euryarchaeota archaeon]MBU4032540.1 carbamate kinase [Candidatus Thermoplasmatota archaeon]MBU4072013.1 carbamate kinase [Candidatus Thermoplasmatota archaeon]MBU4144544.1 carbamate kinase [Candidatus Thermoplasmatota archaeon]MBU4592093.1 carbamate kinase [Candidatus Thermoplasmatota archaeon]
MKTAIIAIGGNALIKKGEEGNIYQQFANARETCAKLLKVVEMGYDIIITHGNGPQVGHAIRRHENARKIFPPYPLGMCVAETVGSMGYMLQQTMQNTVKKSKVVRKDTVTIITQVVVDDDDPSFQNPTKPIGQFFSKEDIEKIAKAEKWAVIEDSGRGWRRVVPSPKPLRIVEKDTIGDLLAKGKIVIACGGGGLPVIQLEDGTLDGVEAVIDKDYASSKLAQQLDLDELIILTSVDKVSLNFGKPDYVDLDILTVAEAKKHLKDGQFPPGSMGPKIESAIEFIESGGKKAVIASHENLVEAMRGKAGTRIVR